MRNRTLIAWLLGLVALMVAFSLLVESLAALVQSKQLRALAGCAVGVGGFVAILTVLRLIARRWPAIPPPRFGSLGGFSTGLAVGLAASIASGLLIALQQPQQDASVLMSKIQLARFVGNVSPALLEEASMRAGVVHLLDVCHGTTAGLIGGSVPFGLLHIVSKMMGQPVSVEHVLGTTAAGLLLSLLYLRFGLGAAVACHWIWNSLAGAWAHYLGFPDHGGVRAFEGAWETIAVLVALCIVVGGVRPSFWKDRRSPSPTCEPGVAG